jgi:hypothetical protein
MSVVGQTVGSIDIAMMGCSRFRCSYARELAGNDRLCPGYSMVTLQQMRIRLSEGCVYEEEFPRPKRRKSL